MSDESIQPDNSATLPVLHQIKALRSLAWALGGLLVLIVFGSFFIVSQVPTLAWIFVTLGFFSLVAGLFFAFALLFRLFGLHAPEHALALPKNSIRSLLTFLIFVLLLTFIFFSVQAIDPKNGGESVAMTKARFDALMQDQEFRARVISSAVAFKPKTDAAGKKVKDENGKVVLVEMTGYLEVRLERRVNDELFDYLDRILIALFGIASSIIGFYFGSRSAVPGLVPPPPNRVWSVQSPDLRLKPDGADLAGTLIIDAAGLARDAEFSGDLVPPDGVDEVPGKVAVTRKSDRLYVKITGAAANDLKGAQLSLGPKSFPDDRRTVSIEVV